MMTREASYESEGTVCDGYVLLKLLSGDGDNNVVAVIENELSGSIKEVDAYTLTLGKPLVLSSAGMWCEPGKSVNDRLDHLRSRTIDHLKALELRHEGFCEKARSLSGSDRELWSRATSTRPFHKFESLMKFSTNRLLLIDSKIDECNLGQQKPKGE